MKRKNKTLALALAILGVTALFLGAAVYAKYIASIEGKAASASVAKWAFKEENENKELKCDLTGTYNSETLVNGKIAPGTKGTCEFELSNKNSEVGVDYTITLAKMTGPQNVVFKYDGNYVAEGQTIAGSLKLNETKTITVDWEWKYYVSATDDAEDTIDGRTAAGNATTGTDKMEVTFNVSGVQADPTR